MIKFSSQKSPFFMFFLHCNSRLREQGSPKLAHMTLSLILMLSQFAFFCILLFASTEQINSHMPKFANKNKSTTRPREVPVINKIANGRN